MGFLITLLYFLFFVSITYWINKKYISNIPTYTLPILFTLKTGYAAFFLYIYTFHYGGGELTMDAGMFFKESQILYHVFNQSPTDYFQFLFGLNDDPAFIDKYLEATSHWNSGLRFLLNDSRNVIRANSLILFLSGGYVFVHFIIFSFFSFLGGFDLFQWLKKKTQIPHVFLLIILTLAPSVAFWSSSIIKEPLMILGLCLLLRGLFDNLSIQSKSWRILLGILLMIGFKTYVGIFILPVIIYLGWSYFFKKQWLAFSLFLAIGIFGIVAIKLSNKVAYIISNQQEDFYNVTNGGLYLEGDKEHYYYIEYRNRDHFNFSNEYATLTDTVTAFKMKRNENYKRFPFQLDSIGNAYKVHLNWDMAGSRVYITPIEDNYWKMWMIAPEALFNAFCQPIPNKSSTWLQYPALLENIIYIISLILAFFFFPKQLEDKDKRIISSLWVYVLLIGLIIGWTTPVSGAIVRYFIPAQVALLVIFILKFDYIKFKKRFFT
ncbi:MAG: hypothetical protein H3C31_03200 [Brumimicrobium sp.]|nr:hypothetical protein [Brumimicrobium sp.]MCO5268603.1 hypothetical protein [Brumimicrobium sp.]